MVQRFLVRVELRLALRVDLRLTERLHLKVQLWIKRHEIIGCLLLIALKVELFRSFRLGCDVRHLLLGLEAKRLSG